MELIGVRELQHHASAVLRRVERGKTLGVTDRARQVAVLPHDPRPPAPVALLASGRGQSASRTVADGGAECVGQG